MLLPNHTPPFPIAPGAHAFTGATIYTLRDALGAALRRWTRTPAARQHAFHHEHVLGTSFELQVVATSADVASHAESAALSELDRLARILSSYSSTSELSRWQAHHGEFVPVSPELLDVLEAAESWRVKTDDAFNPAAVSIMELLRDTMPSHHDAGMHATTHSAAHADALADLTAVWHDTAARERAVCALLRVLHEPLWVVDREHGTACRLTRLSVSLDAIAKGYIVDRVAHCARSVEGVSQVLVNIGGDLRHIGDRPLRVAVTDPAAPAENAPPIAVVHINNGALATSGGYRRGFMSNGRRVSHIIDPHTGEPAQRIASASVIAPDCATADALSTAFSVMDPQRSVALANELDGVACLLVEDNGTITTNDRWDVATVASQRDAA